MIKSKKMTSEEIKRAKATYAALTLESLNDSMMRNASSIRLAEADYDMPEVVRYIHLNAMIQWEINARTIKFIRDCESGISTKGMFWECRTIDAVLKKLNNSAYATAEIREKALQEAVVRIKELTDG